MEKRELNYYEPCDKAIKAMNRENVEAFGRLKMAKWDEVNVIRTVISVYRASARKARKKYMKVAHDAYMIGMMLLGEEEQTARKRADKAITEKWVDRILDETDFVTLYRFNSEAERKAYRLAEQLEVVHDRNLAIDKALRDWSRQLGQYAINFTDYAVEQAYEDDGIKKVEWITMNDERTCEECRTRHGRVYRIDEIPPKHYGCRCTIRPAKK